jgi:hypothetical protein
MPRMNQDSRHVSSRTACEPKLSTDTLTLARLREETATQDRTLIGKNAVSYGTASCDQGGLSRETLINFVVG